jgi:transposase InsO family protein
MSLSTTYPISLVCNVLDLPRNSYYYAPATRQETVLTTALQQLATTWPSYGYRRLTKLLQRDGWAINHKHVARLMGELGLLGAPPRRRTHTTDSQHSYGRYPNLVTDLVVAYPDQVWVADITYIDLPSEVVYLAVLMDVFTRAIRGWHLSRRIDQDLTLSALTHALTHGKPHIHHSDQGVQYAATAYVTRLEALGTHLSMAAVGQPRQNGYAERLMRTIKDEAVTLHDYRDFHEAYIGLSYFLDEVNPNQRIHSALGYLTPSEFEAQWRRQHGQP